MESGHLHALSAQCTVCVSGVYDTSQRQEIIHCLCMFLVSAELPTQGGSALLQGGPEHRRRDVQQRECWAGAGGILGSARPEGAPQRLHQVQSSAG